MQKIKAYIVSLKDHPRRLDMTHKIEKLGCEKLDFRFFDACIYRHKSSDKFPIKYDNLACKLLYGRALSENEIGCFFSHYQLWQKCIEINENILILEDDINFKEGFKIVVPQMAKKKFDLIRLFTTVKRPLWNIKDNYFLSTNSVNGGTVGYYLSVKAAKNLVKNCKKITIPVDDYLDSYYRHSILSTIYFPHIIDLDDTPSSISRGKRSNLFFRFTRGIYLRIYEKTRQKLFLRKLTGGFSFKKLIKYVEKLQDKAS